MENLNNLDSLSNFSNDNLDYNDIQKMIFLNNALSDGWTIRKICINKYELITETGHLKLDRVGYSSLAYPFAYGCIPRTWDEDGDPLDIEIVGVTEPLIPGSIVEARIIGVMKFDDGGEVDDKVIAVLADDKRMDHISSYEDLGDHWLKETKYY